MQHNTTDVRPSVIEAIDRVTAAGHVADARAQVAELRPIVAQLREIMARARVTFSTLELESIGHGWNDTDEDVYNDRTARAELFDQISEINDMTDCWGRALQTPELDAAYQKERLSKDEEDELIRRQLREQGHNVPE